MVTEVLPLDQKLDNGQDSTPESTESTSRQDGVNSNDSSSESNQGADDSSQQHRMSNTEGGIHQLDFKFEILACYNEQTLWNQRGKRKRCFCKH